MLYLAFYINLEENNENLFPLHMKQLDRIDYRILQILQQDAKSTIKEIAGKLGMTTTPVYERIKRMEEDGYIKNYVALLNRNLLGLNLVAYCSITLQEQSKPAIDAFEADVRSLIEVIECYHTAGQYDYLIKVVVKDMEDYHRFTTEKLSSIPFIDQNHSSFIMKEVKNSTALILD